MALSKKQATKIAKLFNTLTVSFDMHVKAETVHDAHLWNSAIVEARDELKAIGISPIGFDHFVRKEI